MAKSVSTAILFSLQNALSCRHRQSCKPSLNLLLHIYISGYRRLKVCVAMATTAFFSRLHVHCDSGAAHEQCSALLTDGWLISSASNSSTESVLGRQRLLLQPCSWYQSTKPVVKRPHALSVLFLGLCMRSITRTPALDQSNFRLPLHML